jgi:ankyrin repeat protein
LEIVQLLIKSGANPKTSCPDGDSPLFQASQNGHFKIVKLLALSGADINLKFEGKTPLEIAKLQKKTEIVKFLESIGAKCKISG